MSQQTRNRIPVCECPDHGWITGEDIDNRFPNPERCDVDDCGNELELTMAAGPEELK